MSFRAESPANISQRHRLWSEEKYYLRPERATYTNLSTNNFHRSQPHIPSGIVSILL